jgi:hypothetical protein
MRAALDPAIQAKTTREPQAQSAPPPEQCSGPTLLANGKHPGFSHLKSKPGVYRCLLRPDIKKRSKEHADYKGVLPIANGRAYVLIWVHIDGSLGLRLEKIVERPNQNGATK